MYFYRLQSTIPTLIPTNRRANSFDVVHPMVDEDGPYVYAIPL
jgi:hypothetical protein